MNRLRQPGDSDYDVLGVSPEATHEEIDKAFRQLIDGQNYKVGIPLKRQWLRAHQIKAAHATLADPATRRAYDESLNQSAGPALWATAAHDPETDKLVLQASEPEASEPLDHESASLAIVSDESDEGVLTRSEPVMERNDGPRLDAEIVVGTIRDEPPATYPEAANNDDKRAAVKRWGMAAAVAAGMGLMLFSFWPDGIRQAPAGERQQRATTDAEQASGAGPGLIQSPGNLKGASAENYERGAPSGDSPATTRQNVGSLAATRTAGTQSTAAATPTGTTPAGVQASTTSVEVAETEAIVPTSAPPVASPQAVATMPVVAKRTGSPVRRPPQWVGGGPIDADNRRGRYQGEVTVQVAVEPSGRVSNCAPVRGSGNAGLDAMTCRLIRDRARFSPALDAEGRPVTGQVYTTIVWGRRQRN